MILKKSQLVYKKLSRQLLQLVSIALGGFVLDAIVDDSAWRQQ
jgi:hypothetical protein